MAHVVFQQPKYHMAHTWIFQVCKICAFSPKNKLPKGRNFYRFGRSRYVYHQSTSFNPQLIRFALLWAYQISKLTLFPERPSCFTIFNLHQLIFHLFFCFSEKNKTSELFRLHPGLSFNVLQKFFILEEHLCVTRVVFPQI